MQQEKQQNKVISFILKNLMPVIAITLAVITCFFVPIDSQYLGYFDFSTLSCLFCTLAVVAAYKNVKFFTYVAKKIVLAFGNLRNVTIALVFVTYFGSMIMANDMALITFLPLGFVALDSCGKRDKMAFVFVMQNVAANLGGMLTPFGNPQNLYLYSYFNMQVGQFVGIMALPFAVAFVLILSVCFTVKPEKISLTTEQETPPPVWRTIVYGLLFVLSVLIVFKVLPWYVCFGVVTLSMCLLDVKALAKVDYGLLLTFSAFFVFSGNLARIQVVNDFLGTLIDASPLLVGVACCQVISNVPSAVLLSHFTTDVGNLLVAVNIGGLGTPIASLASLITLNEYRKNDAEHLGKYVALFELINFGFLAILVTVQLLVSL